MGSFTQKKDSNNSADPVDDYGPGVQAYFRLLQFLMVIFFGLTILMLPVMVIYINGGGYQDVIQTFDSLTRSSIQASLGNLGFSITQCTHQFVSITDHPFHLVCS